MGCSTSFGRGEVDPIKEDVGDMRREMSELLRLTKQSIAKEIKEKSDMKTELDLVTRLLCGIFEKEPRAGQRQGTDSLVEETSSVGQVARGEVMQGILFADYSVEGVMKCETWCVQLNTQRFHFHSQRIREGDKYSERHVTMEICNGRCANYQEIPKEVMDKALAKV